MKKLLLAITLATTLAACEKDCSQGYTGSNCQEEWSTAYARSWIGTVNCGNGSAAAVGLIEAETPTRIRIDGQIYAELTAPDHFDIPTQSYMLNSTTYTVQGSGSLSNGQLSMVHTTVNNGQSVYCVFNMN